MAIRGPRLPGIKKRRTKKLGIKAPKMPKLGRQPKPRMKLPGMGSGSAYE